MFGLIQPCGHIVDDELREQWRAHMCGLCLSLRDGHGQAARLTTNTDAVMVSVLTAAQLPTAAQTVGAGPCALRGMRRADVVAADTPGVLLATSASLTLATAKARDAVAEQRRGLAPRAPLKTRAASAAARRLGRHVSDGPLASSTILSTLDSQADIECTTTDLDALTEPSARACAAVFAASAVDEANLAALIDIGSDFGRLAHLLDAVDDRDDDAETGAFNPLTAAGVDDDAALDRAGMLADRIAMRYRDLALHDDRLLRALLVDAVAQAVRRRRQASTLRQMRAAARPYAHLRTWPAERPLDWPEKWPYPPPFPPNRPWIERVLPFVGVSCFGPALCTSHWNHCTDKHKAPCIDDPCSGCNCGDCCDCSC